MELHLSERQCVLGCITAIGVSLPYLKTRERYPSIYSIGAIEDLETFDYSPLRGNFGPTSAAGSARPSLSSTHYGLQRQWSSRVTRRSASVEKPPQGRHFHLAGVIWLINVGKPPSKSPQLLPQLNKRPERQWPLPLARQRPQTFLFGQSGIRRCRLQC